ncbi:SGNH/GDSL hydrolase family protein [Pseudomonas sp. GX19020]|uniref:SGNH/GDSL hydrolase family protein n=1 Tax=Pseudomonas sp. GX19020 TaxID=2942277 RepID=UPI002018E144|nr:SGNH/GDSL hydrolase family protein [Pseudomonas sp. GX19020]MCL4068995.1 SGNH/GDSL hydrolase family protein [Pseudomonas sp. GX19020]
MKGPEEAVVVGGIIDKTLNRTSASERGTLYDVIYTYPNAAARGQWLEEPLGSISLTGPGPVALAELLMLPTPEPTAHDAVAQALGAAASAGVDAGRAEEARAGVEVIRDEVVDLAQFPLAKGYMTRAAAVSATDDLGLYGAMQTTGYAVAGDGGGASYLRHGSITPGGITTGGGFWRLLTEQGIVPAQVGAKGDGVANDSAAFATLEALVSGQVINLMGRTHVVTAIPAGNKYINGFFSVGGLTRSTLVLGELDDAPAAVWRFGGQIAQLARALGDPFRQYIKISLLGDSITWGQTLPENGADAPRDATGSDARNLYNTASWANELKRWIGKQYANGAAPVLSNWPASPSGESIATFSRTDGVFPAGPKFTVTITGGSFTQQTLYNAAYPYGAQHRFTDGSGGGSSGKYAFKMTGKEFTFFFDALASGCLDYTVWVNGVQLGGVYSTTLGEDGNTARTRRHHALPAYTVDAEIEIRTVNNAGAGATQSLYTYAIEFRRQIVISNQGINGTSFMTYRNNMLTSGGFGDGLAVDAEDGFIFIQLGTNDRGKRPDLSYTLSEARGHAQALIDTVKTLSPTAKLIMMCANRPTLDGPPDFKCTMGDIRQMLLETAQDNTLDLIDNFAPFVRADAGKFLADGLHPNRLGHGLMARNIINAIRGM